MLRTVQIDLEPGVFGAVRASPLGELALHAVGQVLGAVRMKAGNTYYL